VRIVGGGCEYLLKTGADERGNEYSGMRDKGGASQIVEGVCRSQGELHTSIQVHHGQGSNEKSRGLSEVDRGRCYRLRGKNGGGRGSKS